MKPRPARTHAAGERERRRLLHSRKVPQLARTRAGADAPSGTVACGDGRLWMPCLLMACKKIFCARAQAGAKWRTVARLAHAGARGHSRRASNVRCERSGAGTMKADPQRQPKAPEAQGPELAAIGGLPVGWHHQAEPRSRRASTMAGRAKADYLCILCSGGFTRVACRSADSNVLVVVTKDR